MSLSLSFKNLVRIDFDLFKPSNAWAILTTTNKSDVKTKILDFFFIGAFATKSWVWVAVSFLVKSKNAIWNINKRNRQINLKNLFEVGKLGKKKVKYTLNIQEHGWTVHEFCACSTVGKNQNLLPKQTP